MSDTVQVKRLDRPEALRARLAELDVPVAVDDEVEPAPGGPLAEPLALTRDLAGRSVGNRFTVLPMEGWDGTPEGGPTDLVRRRWARFGESGAKLVWGGEAVAVRPSGRANPRQLVSSDATAEGLAELRRILVAAHEQHHGPADDLVVGLQLTHSGRWSRPEGTPAPVAAYHHPLLDRRVGLEPDDPVLDDAELAELVDDYVAAARRAAEAGFDFVDLKACHGYLGHELLSGVDRPGPYGGDLDGRSRFLRDTVAAVRAACPHLGIGVRLSIFDLVPHHPGPEGTGVPEDHGRADEPYRFAFGGDGSGTGIDLAEPIALLDRLAELDVGLVCATAGSPYYVPHVQRPAYFPPSDGYAPPEDPLVGVGRLLAATRRLTEAAAANDQVVVGSGYSYLQDWLGHVAQREVRDGGVHSVGVGRMVLSYPDLPADLLAGEALDRRRICRTFSDCTTAPRNGLVSGCYPLDEHYKAMPERLELARAKKAARTPRPRRGPSPPRRGAHPSTGGPVDG